MRTESAEYLQSVYEAIWHALGAQGEEAEVYARCFVRADLLGKETQGIAAIPLVYPWVEAGAIQFGRSLTTVREGPSFALVDGNSGPGQVVATRAMAIAIDKARENTVGCVWVRNANDFTLATAYAEMALEHDYFGLAMSNGVPLVAAWGGRDPIFNTNPMSFVVPAGEELPIIYDGATSAVSTGTSYSRPATGGRCQTRRSSVTMGAPPARPARSSPTCSIATRSNSARFSLSARRASAGRSSSRSCRA